MLVLCFLPIFINWLSTRETSCELLYKPSVWASFWSTYLGAIASFAMVFITWLTLREMRKQWEEERNPHIVLSIGIVQKCLFIKVHNTGILPAYNVKLAINEDFLSMIPEDVAKECLSTMVEPFFIDGKSTKFVFIGEGNSLEEALKGKGATLIVTGTYCNNRSIDKFICNFDEIVGKKFARIVDDLTLAVEGLEKSISSAKSAAPYKTIQASLDSIATSLENNK